jgi:fibro-slime domain-containing protein
LRRGAFHAKIAAVVCSRHMGSRSRNLASSRPPSAGVKLAALIAALAAAACGSKGGGSATGGNGADASGNNSGGDSGNGSGGDDGPSGSASDATNGGDAPSLIGDSGVGDDSSDMMPGEIHATVRDFRFYDAGDPTTDPDFENPPYDIGPDGGPDPGYQGDWDDRAIVTNMLGSDKKPVFMGNPTTGTLTTRGNGSAMGATAEFDPWYNDVPGTNIKVDYPLPLMSDGGVVSYDSNVQGQLYDPANPSRGRGFFPIDDGTPYATSFGNQGKPHNYSFTVEIHTVFTYKGGEYFHFRGDDDVFVYINNRLVLNVGGIHNPEVADVNVDTLGLTPGQSYPLDFFSAERHVVGSNILFETTLKLRPPTQ